MIIRSLLLPYRLANSLITWYDFAWNCYAQSLLLLLSIDRFEGGKGVLPTFFPLPIQQGTIFSFKESIVKFYHFYALYL